MDFLWSMFHLFLISFILSIQYASYEASPLHGPSVEVAPLDRFPFIVSLNNKTILRLCRTAEYDFATELAHFCSGSMITTEHVLTAAHCLPSSNQFNDVGVKVESTNLRTKDDFYDVNWGITYGQYYKIKNCDKNGNDVTDDTYDIAIMKLKESVRSDFPLPTISYIPNWKLYQKTAVMGGWGREKNHGKLPRNMRIGKTFILGPEACSAGKSYRAREFHNALYLCSDPSMASAGPGDSGGPLLYDGVDRDYPNNIVGVTIGAVDIEEGAPFPVMNEHMSVFFSKGFIESVTTMAELP